MKKLTILSAAVMLALSAPAALAKVSQADADKLGTTLTPMGAEKAANADGSIPAWTGGISKPIAGYTKGMHHPDPFPTDKVLFTITNENKAQYAEFLTPGQKQLFEVYPDTYKMNVYESRRTAAVPQYVYDATKANAVRAELVSQGNGITGATIGVPFPIPANGLEVIWNHILRYLSFDVKTYPSPPPALYNGY